MMGQSEKKTISLMSNPYPALIFPCASGIIINQQAGGVHCSTDEYQVEGIFLPLPFQGYRLPHFMNALEALHPGCGSALTFEEACKLNDLLKMYDLPLDVVDVLREVSTEAWVHVRIMTEDDHWYIRPNASTIHDYQQFARHFNPAITKEEVERILGNNIRGDLSMLSDFAGESAILTWENCD